ncbi:MAG: hypothetical protein Q9203_007570, partial [Teloschistes exilis]
TMPPKSRKPRAQPQQQEDRSTSTLGVQQPDIDPSQTREDDRIEELSSNAPSEPEDEEGEEDYLAPEDDADNLAPPGESSNQINPQLRTQKKPQTMREVLLEERLKAKDATIKAQNLELQLLRERHRRRSDDEDDRERSSNQPFKFKEEDTKVRFGSMRITDKKKRQWRDHASCLIDPPTWETFKSYLLDLTSRPEIRAYDSEERLEKAAQRNGQTISDFAQYLESNILNPFEQLLRKEGKPPPLTKSYNSDNGQSGQPTCSRATLRVVNVLVGQLRNLEEVVILVVVAKRIKFGTQVRSLLAIHVALLATRPHGQSVWGIKNTSQGRPTESQQLPEVANAVEIAEEAEVAGAVTEGVRTLIQSPSISRETTTPKKALVVTIVVTTEKKGRFKVKCLIHSGAECNFVSQSWIISNDLPFAFEPKSVKAIDGRTVRSYGTHKLDITVEDNDQVRNRELSKFHAVDMMGYDMILGYPWLYEVDPDIR